MSGKAHLHIRLCGSGLRAAYVTMPAFHNGQVVVYNSPHGGTFEETSATCSTGHVTGPAGTAGHVVGLDGCAVILLPSAPSGGTVEVRAAVPHSKIGDGT